MASARTSGNAANLTDLRTALENFLVASGGWAAVAGTGTNRLLSKAAKSMYVRIGTDTYRFYLYGGTGISGSALTGESTTGVCIGNPTSAPMSFPVNYEIYWNDTPEEIYMVVSYNGDKYQHMHFGKSDIPNVGGTGLWFSGAHLANNAMDTGDQAKMYMTYSRSTVTGYGILEVQALQGVRGGYFCGGDSYNVGAINCALEGSAAWREAFGPSTGQLRRQIFSSGLITALPSLFNESEVLLPIQVIMNRASSLLTTVAELRHARFLRLDNLNAGDIVTYGSDQWKVYPIYARNTVDRNGVSWSTGAYHSGTYGVAIRYPGA
jgi:hypothetical protein